METDERITNQQSCTGETLAEPGISLLKFQIEEYNKEKDRDKRKLEERWRNVEGFGDSRESRFSGCCFRDSSLPAFYPRKRGKPTFTRYLLAHAAAYQGIGMV